MTLELVRIAASQHDVLRHLVDLYAYDFSEMLGIDVEDNGRFAFRDLSPYWRDEWRHPFFITMAGKLAGFVLVDGLSRLSGDTSVRDMSEFFVLRKYRRQGVGERAAIAAFRSFPGPSEVRERASNTPAIAFWRRIIDRYTGGDFRDVEWNDEKWRGPVQSFEK